MILLTMLNSDNFLVYLRAWKLYRVYGNWFSDEHIKTDERFEYFALIGWPFTTGPIFLRPTS